MMWIFKPIIAEKRKEYDFLVTLLQVDGFAGAARRKGIIVRSEEPEQYPLSRMLPPTVEIEYTDNHSKTCRTRVPVTNLTLQDPKSNCELLIVKGPKQGRIVRHVKTVGEEIKYREEISSSSSLKSKSTKLPTLPKKWVCPLQKYCVDDKIM